MKEINYDYVVIGSGPAGSILSKFLSEKNYKIAIVDRATDKLKGKKNFIFNPYINKCPNYYTPSFSNQIGGNSALWHKKIYLISKDEVAKGKWPLKYSEILKYSHILARKLKINHKYLIQKNNPRDVFKYSRSNRAKFSNVYHYLELDKKKNIKTYKSSSPVKLFFKDKKMVNAVEILNLENNTKIKINISKALIFCAGGLGNTFLIKNLLKELKNKSGNFLCDHPHIQIINLSTILAQNFKKISKVFLFSSEKKKKEKKNEYNIYINEKNYFGGIQLSSNIDPTLLLSRLYLKSSLFSFIGWPFKIFSITINLIIFFINILFKIYYKILDLIGIPGRFSFEFFFSQKKDPSNNLKLNKKKDNYGLRKLDINWSISKEDINSYNKIINKFLKDSQFFKKRIFSLNKIENKVYVGLHPSCSNSMGSDSNSIIDKNLKIKKFSNLFVCGSDVFPSNGFTNPTWTIMTLGTRLSYFLNKKFD